MDQFKEINYKLDFYSNFIFIPKPVILANFHKKNNKYTIVLEERVTMWNCQNADNVDNKEVLRKFISEREWTINQSD